ncbi:MAG: terpene cyclase/mutase family protein [Pirellulales bacterium]|nr:terpene cyclase/mutase family protein [Pirellulales bacterium]
MRESQGADQGVDAKQFAETVERGIQFLSKTQGADGSFSRQAGIGPTALAVLALLRNGRTPDDPRVAKGLEYLASMVQEDGSIHPRGSRLANYETCIAATAFQAANADGRYDQVLDGAVTFLRGVPWDEKKGRDKSDVYYGGAGYGGDSRPDLSNTAFLVDTLRECGADSDDEAIQRALVFISRCQNLESEHNTTQFAAKTNDGGFYYTCALDEQDLQREGAAGGLRSYGGMTYSGLKSMLYAGLAADDPRVKAAVGWISQNYDVTSNPGMGDAGLFYYYHTFAKALAALGESEITDAAGKKHDWRAELVAELANRQNENGSWVNENSRWLEGDPNLVTSFSLIALSYCRPEAGK